MANETENTKASAATESAGKAGGKKGAAGAVKRKKRVKKNIAQGIVYIQASFNNTLVTITDQQGNVICWSSSGARGFAGSKKSTPFAAQIAAEDAARKAVDHGMQSAEVFVKGPGAGRETALRALGIAGIRVTRIQDSTPLPHNGCRPPKKRRV